MASITPAPTLIVAASSDIGRAVAHCYAAAGCPMILTARDPADLATLKSDLEIRHCVSVRTIRCDVTDADPEPFVAALSMLPETVIMIAGLLGSQEEAAADASIAARIMATNYNGPARVLLALARRMEKRGHGTIIGISSVAGDRGRASNFVYGSAKAGFTAFLSGLRNHLAKKGVRVITVKPGFVATRMTQGMDLPPSLTAQPDAVALSIMRAHAGAKDVVYVKPIWRIIMIIIQAIPERIFKNLSL